MTKMQSRWQPGPEHQAQAKRVEQLEQRAEKHGAERRRDVLALRLEIVQRGREERE